MKRTSSYFILAPDIDVSGPNKTGSLNVKSRITLNNIYGSASGIRRLNRGLNQKSFLIAYVLRKGYWDLLLCNEVEMLQSSSFTRSDFSDKADPQDQIVFFMAETSSVPQTTTLLPQPRYFYSSGPVADRATISFELEASRTSFLGEYPFPMASTKTGSLVSFNHLIPRKKDSISSYVLFYNLYRDATLASTHDITVFNSSKNKKTYYHALSNHVTALDLPASLERSPYQISCRTCSFIPVFLTLDTSSHPIQMSVEHTHPPHEMYWGPSTAESVSIIKNRQFSI